MHFESNVNLTSKLSYIVEKKMKPSAFQPWALKKKGGGYSPQPHHYICRKCIWKQKFYKFAVRTALLIILYWSGVFPGIKMLDIYFFYAEFFHRAKIPNVSELLHNTPKNSRLSFLTLIFFFFSLERAGWPQQSHTNSFCRDLHDCVLKTRERISKI